MLIYDIGGLIASPQGTIDSFDVEELITLPEQDDPLLTEPIRFQLEFIKLRDEVTAHVSNLAASCEMRCNRCLITFTAPVVVSTAERQFWIHLPEGNHAEIDTSYQIDRKHGRIDLNQMIREEILLHFPPIPLCSESCKGLCDQCGTDLNKSSCACAKPEVTKESPFAGLKSQVI
ncbi:hypothetical protein COV82_03665 [Candidatus Peregrinibacteria bacterium CG11_big_fil_rev_8_21_14_0_20_46_8]|nr:MAG: hypothetical protein COV82_03665 [Candidatus Peregrinibacteria bacterium CG11_big_fil_rev_8_21_14_0_20_46_8]